MSNIFEKNPSSLGLSVLIVSAALSHGIPLAREGLHSGPTARALRGENYQLKNPPTYTHIVGGFTGEPLRSFDDFEQIIQNFYSRLLASQEELGTDFEKALYNNLWDLYES